MERGKGGSGRGGKSKTPQFPADLFALGSKTASDNKQRTTGPKVGVPSILAGDRERKREGATIPPIVPPKKAKVTPLILSKPSASAPSSSSVSTPTNDSWEQRAVEIDPLELVPLVTDASDMDEVDKAIGFICGAIKLLKTHKYKLDSALYQSLAYLSKLHTSLFMNDCIVGAVCSLLRKEVNPSATYKPKPNISMSVSLLAINILMSAFQDTKRWPDSFVKIYLEDAGGERVWVDNELCKNFVDNIITSLNTKPITVQVTDVMGRPEQTDEDLVPLLGMSLPEGDRPEVVPPVQRFRWNKDLVESIVLESVKEQLSRRQSTDLITKNFLKMLTSVCGVAEIRCLVSSRLEAWLQNPKLMRPAQELLMSLCVNCTSHTKKDVEVISSLIKMRLKTKAVNNYYLSGIKELIGAHRENLSTVLKHTIYNELSTSRNPNNMAIISVIFQFDQEKSAKTLSSEIFQELLLNRDDYLRPLRALLREVARVLRSDLNLKAFCRGLMSTTEPLPHEADTIRAFNSTIDLISLCIFLALGPHARSDKKDVQMMERMQSTITSIQNDCIWWFRDSVLPVYRLGSQDFSHGLFKILMLEPLEQYYKTDNWPPEQDRILYMRIASEVPLTETTVVSILKLGSSKDHPLTPTEAIDIIDQLVKRAACISNPVGPVLKVEKVKVIDMIFNLCAYRHPENIDLPYGYKPPTLAIISYYWKAWTFLLILCTHNPQKFGAIGWEKYPTLRVLMEMCITGHFAFPPGFDDLQMLALEKQNILEFESHLAAASTKMEITEQTSLLLSQLQNLDPLGPPRRPPPTVLDFIKSNNGGMKLGHLLCRSRDPDFLLEIIQRQGSSQSMPWLAELVNNSEGALNHLPVQCLCEFLLSTSHKQEGKYQQLLSHLQTILTDPRQDPENVCEILDYFLKRLGSPHNRGSALAGLKLLISPIIEEEVMDVDKSDGKDDPSWLMKQLPMLPHFKEARHRIVASIRGASLVENDPDLVTTYLCFLAEYSTGGLNEMTELVVDMAQLIVERSSIMSAIVPSNDDPNVSLDAFVTIFYSYLTKAREPRRAQYTWSESQDQVLVTWPSGEECTIHILVVHAMVILLTYGPVAVTKHDYYNHLLDVWFPENPDRAPKGFLVDTSEEALLIPDWLKLRMIRSDVSRLVEAALTDLDMTQLILFIQSFGIPINSMSKLLAALDCAVETNERAVSEAVIDKTYMIQLVEVQHRRGAVGGDVFTKRILNLHESTSSTSMDVDEKKPIVEKPLRTPRAKPAYLDEANYSVLLEIYKVLMVGVDNPKEEREHFTAIQRYLIHMININTQSSQIHPVFFDIVRYLHKKLTGDIELLQKVVLKSQFSCPLFRLLTKFNHPFPYLVELAQLVVNLSKKTLRVPKSLLDIFASYLSKQETPSKEKEEDTKPDKDGDSLTKAMEGLLLCTGHQAGQLVDQLVRLEPEILGTSVNLQMKLLFSVREKSTLSCRPYLLTLLTHHASWRTLSQCVDMLLNPPSVKEYEATPVLDFLKALTCNPKLWQGREKHTPKHYTPEDVLNLNIDQLKCMVDYIVLEGVQLQKEEHEETADKSISRVQNRLNLLCQCIRASSIQYAGSIARHLMNKTSDPSIIRLEKDMSNLVLVQLYLRIPSLVTQLPNTNIEETLLENGSQSVGGSSTLDVMSHTLITALSATPNLKEWSKRALELELAIRKMASTHPLLILRQLPMIASSLKGRVDLEWIVFKSRNHFLFFQQILALLEMLQPAVFKDEYSSSLHKTLNIFLEMFLNYGRDGNLSTAVSAFLGQFEGFLQNYIKHSSKLAKKYLQSQAELISELQSECGAFKGLCVVVPGMAGENEVILTLSCFGEPVNQQWDQKVNALNKEGREEMLGVLTTLDYMSAKKPCLLGPIVNTLCGFFTSTNYYMRSTSHNMVLRYLRFNPKAVETALPSYMSCLDSQNPDIVSSALDKLPELVVCSQESAVTLMQKVFTLALQNNTNAPPCITRTIAMLNLQSGC